MNTEQERTEFEAWCETRTLETGRDHEGDYISIETALSWEAYQAGRAALQSQDREDVALAEILREAAQIIAAIPPEHAPENIRWPIADELEGFALKIDHARRIEGEDR